MNSETKERLQRYASGRLPPLRQMVLAGSGSGDSVVTFIGLLVGAAFAHNFGIASSPKGVTEAGQIATVVCIVVLFVIAAGNLKRARS